MDHSFLWLCEVSTAMFLGSMAAGLIPLKLSIAERKMRWLSIFGAGLLIGTAFTVIIPEGIETLYNARSDMQETPVALQRPVGQRHNLQRIERGPNSTEKIRRHKRHVHGGHQHSGHNECEESRTPNINTKLGFSLIMGFMFMLLVDQMSSRPREERAARGRMGVSATIGLVVHAAVDGVAMGTSSFSDQDSLKWIVFFAIMLHKMPAAFGLVTFLGAARISTRRIWKHLTVFSLAAPTAALTTFWMMNWVTLLSSQVAIGCLMLFSGGTFMYVATIHVLPELNRRRDEDDFPSEREAMIVDVQKPTLRSGHSHAAGPTLSLHDLFFMIIGSLLPGLSLLFIH